MSVANDEQLSDFSKSDREESVCVNMEGNEEKIETDMKDNEKNVVVIRIESSATEIEEKNTDSLNSNNSCEKSDQSLTGSEKSTETASSEEDGVSNPAFVEDDDVGGVKQKKGHRRQPSCSPNKDIEVRSPLKD